MQYVIASLCSNSGAESVIVAATTRSWTSCFVNRISLHVATNAIVADQVLSVLSIAFEADKSTSNLLCLSPNNLGVMSRLHVEGVAGETRRTEKLDLKSKSIMSIKKGKGLSYLDSPHHTTSGQRTQDPSQLGWQSCNWWQHSDQRIETSGSSCCHHDQICTGQPTSEPPFPNHCPTPAHSCWKLKADRLADLWQPSS